MGLAASLFYLFKLFVREKEKGWGEMRPPNKMCSRDFTEAAGVSMIKNHTYGKGFRC